MTKKEQATVLNLELGTLSTDQQIHLFSEQLLNDLSLLNEKETLALAQQKKEEWSALKTEARAIKTQLHTVFDQVYTIIPTSLKELENQLKPLKTDKTQSMVALAQIKSEWKECQDDFTFYFENAYLDITGHELPQIDDQNALDIQSLEARHDKNLLAIRSKERAMKKKISHYTKGAEVLKKHKERQKREQKKLQGNPMLSETLIHLQNYTSNLDIQLLKLLATLHKAALDDDQQSVYTAEIKIFKQFAHDVFHQKPILSTRLRSLLSFIDQEIENALFIKANYFAQKQLSDKQKHTLIYQTEEEKQRHLLKLLRNQTTAIQGEQMDFTFLPAALQEFSKYPEEYQLEAVKKLQRIMNIPLDKGSRTLIAGHAAIDKMRDHDLHKIRAINHNIGEDNLPRIMLKPLSSQGNRERWCVVGFSDEGHQKRQYTRFEKRAVLPWPTNPQDIVVLNPPQTANSSSPSTLPQNIIKRGTQRS